jgi:YHS domain-containing protein
MRIVTLALVINLLAALSCNTAHNAPPGAAVQKQEQKVNTVTDPVCGMRIDPAKAAGKSEYKGTTYYFCSDYCKRTFDANPEAVLTKASRKKS